MEIKELMESVRRKVEYNDFVEGQKNVAVNLDDALNEFENIADMPMYASIEKEVIALRKKLAEMRANPEDFVREFDEAEDW